MSASTDMPHMDGLREADVPPDLLPRVRGWWNRELAALQQAHGSRWPDHREWLHDYMNAEVRARLRAMPTYRPSNPN